MNEPLPGPPDEGPVVRRGLNAVPEAVWAPLAAAALMAVVGAVGLALNQPWIFPSLGPTAFMQTVTPDLPAARLYNTIVGHMVGMLAAFLAVAVMHADALPPLLVSHHVAPARLWASIIAIALTILVHALLKCEHPPAAATTLLITLGGFQTTARDAAVIIAGVLIVGFLGEPLRRYRLAALTARASR